MDQKDVGCHPGDSARALNRLPQLAEARLHFNVAEEIENLRKEESWRLGTGRASKTLAKYSDFRLVLVAMKAGTMMREHRTEGQISIHAVLGHVRVTLENEVADLPAGELLVLDCGVPHGVEAVQESAFLLTIAWPKGVLHE